jgi:hypothetical protein
MLQLSTTQGTDHLAIYVEQPDIPAGITISAYRQARPRQVGWWRRRLRRPSR